MPPTARHSTARRSVAGLLMVAGLLAGGLGSGTASASGSTAPCVAVVVDARLLGASVQTGCARRDPDTGLEALSAAGFSYAPRPRDGLICQIDARPACTDTTTERYWSYWYRPPGSSRWVYASQGAGTHDPAPGSTEGWVWQDGGRREPPSVAFAQICPTRDREPSDPPAATKAGSGPTGEPRDPPATGKKRPVSTRHSSTASATKTSSSSALTATPTSPTPSSAAPSTAAPVASKAATNRRAQPTGDDGGGPWLGLGIGVALVAGLGGATWLRFRRTPGSGP